MNKINKVFANKISKLINNNEKTYYGENKDEVGIKKEPIDVKSKIRKIFNAKNYIYKADVVIETTNGTFKKRVIGRNNKYIITMDNELIPIADIIDIKENS